MYSYVTEELPELVRSRFHASERQSIFGHSMGGHGALVCALRNPETYMSVSAFAPITTPMDVPWGRKAFSGYLGADETAWQAYDATRLAAAQSYDGTILIDQGDADQFLGTQVEPERFVEACEAVGTRVTLRMHEGYDHGYFFIATFVADHLRHHAAYLL
jgi:S-formylglutathione hydrolase